MRVLTKDTGKGADTLITACDSHTRCQQIAIHLRTAPLLGQPESLRTTREPDSCGAQASELTGRSDEAEGHDNVIARRDRTVDEVESSFPEAGSE
jgi:hypothetical protein